MAERNNAVAGFRAVQFEPAGLQDLIVALTRRGFQVVGPTVKNGAIVYEGLGSADDLPRGWTEVQEAATYRLQRRNDDAFFGYTVGPHSWKQFLFPPTLRIWSGKQGDGRFEIDDNVDAPRYAFIGVRSCDLHAIGIQDRVFMGGHYQDPAYVARREGAFVVAINCGEAGHTCFCVSMGTGPRASGGYDIALTEVLEESQHFFIAEPGSERGAEVLGEIPSQPAGDDVPAQIERITARAAEQMGRTLETSGLKELLYRNLEHPRWDDVAGRCLTCGNCTMVCPTCFCATFEDTSDLDGSGAERWRQWDSCFTVDHSYLHGGSVRKSGRSRYRQWMTHKLATWWDQFDTSGCVGCGRCITWCPVGIDITEEARAIRESDSGSSSTTESSQRGES
ncbi:MAG: 4Fe-4S dicluster domain-containing protein [Nitrolancea sp.]